MVNLWKASVKARFAKVEESDVDCSTLHSLVKHNKAAISQGVSLLQAYAPRNTSYEVQKASAISIMATAITVWGCYITEAVNKAAEYTGYCAESVRTWASSFFLSCNSVSSDNVTDEYITEELSSNHGHRDTHTDTLLYSEEFQLTACKFVCNNAYIKGESNLTSQMFAKWIHFKYGYKISDSTAQRWLNVLGYSQLCHQKGVFLMGMTGMM